MHATLPLLRTTDFPPIDRDRLPDTLQVNLGYQCNQQCLHCHVNAGPKRKETMTWETMQSLLRLLENPALRILDLTGGAPELNAHFRQLVTVARQRGLEVIDRCNLTILLEPGQEDLGRFLAAHQVTVTASMPCYLRDNVDKQRGAGVFERSVAGLRLLNELGYGHADSGLQLNLVYNPQGPALPPPQAALETDYKNHLLENYGVRFNRLYTLANMPIQRFGSMLISQGGFADYMHLLKSAYNADNLGAVMCKSLISIDWQGNVYDCDFNQMLGLGIDTGGKSPVHINKLEFAALRDRPIVIGDHCYGCTAGQGSSCGGALLERKE